MPTLNQIMLIGRLGKDPEKMKATGENKLFIRFSLAVDQSTGLEAMWLNVTAWERQAEAVEKFARKGTLVFVQGRLVQKKYKDKSQADRLSVEINATNVQILEKKPKEGDGLPDEVLPEA